MPAKPRPVAVPLSAATQPSPVPNQKNGANPPVASDVTLPPAPINPMSSPAVPLPPQKVSLEEMQDDSPLASSALRPPSPQPRPVPVAPALHTAPARPATAPQPPRYDDVIATAEHAPASSPHEGRKYAAHDTPAPAPDTQPPDTAHNQAAPAPHAPAIHNLTRAIHPAVAAAVTVCFMLIVFAWLVYSKG